MLTFEQLYNELDDLLTYEAIESAPRRKVPLLDGSVREVAVVTLKDGKQVYYDPFTHEQVRDVRV